MLGYEGEEEGGADETGRKDSRTTAAGATATPSICLVVASRVIAVSFGDLERMVRISLTHLVELASGPVAGQTGYELLTRVHLRRWPRWTRVPVVLEVESPPQRGHGTIAHLRWRSQRHPTIFPVMEADLVAHPLVAGSSELVLAGRYRPPLGSLGLVADLLMGHRVAQSTAEAFIDELSQAIEAALAQGLGAAPMTAHRTAEVA